MTIKDTAIYTVKPILARHIKSIFESPDLRGLYCEFECYLGMRDCK